MRTKEQILSLYQELHENIPVDWGDEKSVLNFKSLHDLYENSWKRLSTEDQGWISEKVLEMLPFITHKKVD